MERQLARTGRFAMTPMAPSIVTTNPREASAAPPRSVPAHEVAPGVLLHRSFVNTYALRTTVGLLLIDPGLLRNAQSVHRAVRAWSAAPLHTAVYTHGHVDHAFGLSPFLEAGERPHIVAQENCVERFKRYRL